MKMAELAPTEKGAKNENGQVGPIEKGGKCENGQVCPH